MLGSTIIPMDTGQLGTLDTTKSAREVLMPSQKENLMLMPICTILPMDTGHHGILDITWSAREARKLKENLMLMLGISTTPTDTGQPGTMELAMVLTTGVKLNSIFFQLAIQSNFLMQSLQLLRKCVKLIFSSKFFQNEIKFVFECCTF